MNVFEAGRSLGAAAKLLEIDLKTRIREGHILCIVIPHYTQAPGKIILW